VISAPRASSVGRTGTINVLLLLTSLTHLELFFETASANDVSQLLSANRDADIALVLTVLLTT